MGYESKVYIVEKSKSKFASDPEGKIWAEVLAMFDLCKMGDFAITVFKKPTDAYIISDDGNMKILRDRYDQPLMEASAEDVIAYLTKELKKPDCYRRIWPLLAALNYFADKHEWPNVAVLHYGY